MAELHSLRAYLGKNLQKARAEAGMTQSEAAAAYGTTTPQLSRWENGHITPSVENLCALAVTYGTTPDKLLPKGDDLYAIFNPPGKAEKDTRRARN